jgi:hypothetical protein
MRPIRLLGSIRRAYFWYANDTVDTKCFAILIRDEIVKNG